MMGLKFAVIHFNNGMHGWGYTEPQYAAGLPGGIDCSAARRGTTQAQAGVGGYDAGAARFDYGAGEQREDRRAQPAGRGGDEPGGDSGGRAARADAAACGYALGRCALQRGGQRDGGGAGGRDYPADNGETVRAGRGPAPMRVSSECAGQVRVER